MARNIAGYISNLGKSVAYSAVDKVKAMSPTTGEFASTNAELFKTMYSNIRDYKGTYSKGLNIVQKSKVYEAADLGIKSIFEDISTGKLYNREREDRIAAKITGFGDSDNGFGSFDSENSDFDFSDNDDDFGSWDDVSTGDKVVSATIMDSSRNNAEMVSMAVARSAEHITKTQKASTHLLYTQNLQAYNIFNGNLNSINSNISNLLNFSTTTIQTHAQNASKYFEESTKLMQDQTALLRQIAEAVVPKKEEIKQRAKKTTFSDVVGANGAPDLTSYFDVIKKNISDQMGSISAMNSMFGEDSNALLSFVSSPLKFIPNLIVDKIIPSTLEKTMETFDKSLSGFFGSLMTKFNTMAKDEDNFITSTIGKIFGIRNTVKGGLDTGNYNKGKVDWDGKSRKALIEVIPTHLAKIVSLLSGKTEQVFDYDKGQFIDSKNIKENFKNIKKTNQKRATGDMREAFDKYMQNLTFSSLNEKETLEEDINKFFEQMYSSGELFDLNGKDSKEGYLKYGINPKSFSVIRSMFKNADKHLQHSINQNILEYRDRENQEMMNLEEKADSIFQYMFNNSSLGEFVEKDKKHGGNKSKSLLMKGGLLETVDAKGKNVFFYLQNIYKELSFMRRFSTGSSVQESSPSIITRDGIYSPENGGHSLNEIEIKDTSRKSKATLDREERQRKIARFERNEAKRREKNKSLINISDIDDEDILENSLSSRIKVNRIKDDLEAQKEKKKTLIEKLLETDSISGKTEVVVNNLNRMTKKPMEFITNTINKVDQRMYEVIYGKEGAHGKDVKGFIDVMILQLKSTFGKFNLWLDEKVLTPLKEKLDIQSFGDIGKKFLGMFGIDGDEIGKSIKEYLFGKDNGLFTKIGDSIKSSFKNAFGIAKQSMKDAYGPLFGKIKQTMSKKNKFANLDEIIESYDTNEDIDWSNASKEQIQAEIKRQRALDSVINSDNRLRGSDNLYKGFNFDYSSRDTKSRVNHLLAEKKYYESQGTIDISKKEQLLERLMEEATTPGKSVRPSLLKQIEKLQNEIDIAKGNSTGLNTVQSTINRINTLEKRKEAKQFGKIQINEDYFNRPKKSAQELYDMFPGLVSSPIISERLGQEQQTNSTGLFSSIFDKVVEGIDLLKSMKDSLIELVRTITPSNSKGFTKPSIFNKVSTPFSSNPLVREEDQAIDSFANELGGIISGSIANYIRGNTKKYAEGGYIHEAQVATIGRGEVVLSKEDTENLVSLLSNLMDGMDKNKAKSKLANSLYTSKLQEIDKNLGGINLEDIIYKNEGLYNKYSTLGHTQKNNTNSIIQSVRSQLQNDRNTVLDENGVPVDPIKKAAFEEARPYIQQVGQEFTKGVSVVRNALFGDSVQEDKKSFGRAMDDLTTNITRYAPEAVGSGLLGAGVSLITGAFGGPLLGAAVGAGISLTKNSEKFQEWIFGSKDEEGKRNGGILPKEFMSSVSKYLPDLKTYGIAGAVTGLLPLVPFGPLGGLMLGSGIAFAKKNESIQNALFGESDGLMKPETKEKLKKMLPRMGIGVAGSMMFGPFGFLGNALLGSGLGMLSTTESFNKLVIGEKDKEGKYQGGLLPTLRDTVVDPIKGYMKGLGSRVSDFLKDKIFAPVQSAFAPIKKDVQLLLKGMFDGVGSFLNKMFEKSFGVPLNKMIEEKIIKPITGFIGNWILKPTKWIGKKVLGAPSALIGAYGNSRRKAHIRSGNADYMSAEERMQFRNDHNIYSMGLFGEDRFYERDQKLAGMNNENIDFVLDQLQNIKNDKRVNKENRRASAEDMAKDIIPHFKYTESKNIMKAIKGGDLDSVIDYINKNPKFSQETKHKLRKSLYEKNERFKTREDKRLSDIENKDNIFNELSKLGLDVNDRNIDKYIGLLSSESKARNKTSKEVEEEQAQVSLEENNHNEIVELFNEAISLLRKSVGEEPTREQTREVIDDDGTVRNYVRNSRGRLVVDPSDHTSVMEVRQEQEDEQNRSTFYSRMSEMFQKGKDKLGDTVDNVKEKGSNIFSGLLSGIGKVGSFLKIGGLIATGIMAFMKTSDGENLLLSVAKKVGGWFTSAIGDGLKSILPDWAKKLLKIDDEESESTGTGSIVNDIAESAGYEDGASGIGNTATGVVARQVLTGNKMLGGKALSKLVSAKDLSNKGIFGKIAHYANPLTLAKGIIKTPLKLAGRAVEAAGNGMSKLYAKTTDKLLSKGGETVLKFKDSIVQQGTKYASKATELISDVSGNSELIQSMIKSMKDFMEKLFSNKAIVAILGDKAQAIMKKFIPTVLQEVTQRAAKASTQAITKVIGGLSTGGILNIAWAVADFISGFNQCKDILEITQEPSFGMKVATGSLKALNGLFIVTAFIPEKLWVKLVLDILLPIFNIEDTELQKMREESKKTVEEYATANNVDSMTVQEYNKTTKKSLWTNIKEGTKTIFNNVKNWFAGKGSSKSTTSSYEPSSLDTFTNSNSYSLNYAGNGNSSSRRTTSSSNSFINKLKNQYAGNGTEDIRYMELNSPIAASVTAKQINDWVNPKAGENGSLYNIGDIAIKAYKETGLDPRYLVAHAAQESGWKGSEILKKKNNFFGIGAYNASPGSSALTFTKENGFIEGAKWINHNYTARGQNTLHSMVHNANNHAYCVDDNGNPSDDWVKSIASIMNGSGTITAGSINKNAKWDGVWPSKDYSTTGSTAKEGSNVSEVDASESSTGEQESNSIFNMFSELGTALSNDFSRLFGIEPGDSSSSTSSTSSTTDSAVETSADKINGFTYFSQKESPWAEHNYNLSPGNYQAAGRNVTMARRGCGPTSAAMVIRELTGDKTVTPATIADYSTQTGSSVDAGTAWDLFGKLASKYSLNMNALGQSDAKSYLTKITSKKPMIISGTGGPNGTGSGPFYGGHFVVGTKGDNNSVTINDPVGRAQSKTYKMNEIAPYVRAGWTFDRGGGNGDSTPTRKSSPSINLPDSHIGGNGPSYSSNSSSSSSNYEKILLSIVQVLMKISNNSEYLSKIVDILSNSLGVEISEETKQSIKNNSSNSKKQIVNLIQQSVSDNSNPDNEYLLNLLDGLASQ